MQEHSVIVRIVRALIARRTLVIAVSAVLFVVAGTRMALTYASLRSDMEELLPSTAPSVRALQVLRERLPGLRFLGVVVDTGGPANVPAASRFMDELAARIRAYPPGMVAEVRTDIHRERRFAETYALQLMEPEDVRLLREAVEKRRDWEVTRALGIDLLDEEEDPPPKIPIEDIRKKYEARYGAHRPLPNDRFVSEDGRTAVLLVQVGGTTTDTSGDKVLVDRVLADAADLGFPDRFAPGMRMGFAGDVATRLEELSGLVLDVAASSVIVFVLVGLVIVWFYRSPRALLILSPPLMLGEVCAFGIVALPPLSIHYLNSNTAFLGSIVVGNGINAGIILLARFQEEWRRGLELEDALVVAVETTWRPTLAASLAAATSYGALIFTDFRGFNQFGWIGFFGLVLCWLATYTLGPSLISLWGSGMPRTRPESGPRWGSRAVLSMLHRPRTVLAVSLILATLGGLGIWKRMGTWNEYDFSRLRRRDSWVDGERYWGARMDETLRRYLTPAVVMVDRPEDVGIIEQRLHELRANGKAGRLLDSVTTSRDLLKPRRAESIEEAKKIRELLTPRMKAELSPRDRELVERAVSDEALVPLTPERIPPALTAGMREHDGRIARSLLICPSLDAGTWDGKRMGEFTRDVRAAAVVDGRASPVAGSLLLSSDITQALRYAGVRVTGLALVAVLMVCFLAFRGKGSRAPPQLSSPGAGRLQGRIVLSLSAIASLFVGVLLMMGAMAWLGERLNFSNFVALPITFGIGADYSINMLRRWQSDGHWRDALTATGGAVALCSATTIIGFGSLLAAQNRGLFSFGMFAVAGELACSMTAVVALPCALELASRAGELATRR